MKWIATARFRCAIVISTRRAASVIHPTRNAPRLRGEVFAFRRDTHVTVVLEMHLRNPPQGIVREANNERAVISAVLCTVLSTVFSTVLSRNGQAQDRPALFTPPPLKKRGGRLETQVL